MPFPIELNTKRLNTVQAIWARNKNEIKEEEYNEFYTFVGHDHDKPLFRLHFSADAPLAIQALLFVPPRNFETLGMGRIDSEVNLYCRKVLIQAKAKGLFPEWLRFLKGVVDSEDLPLNISRETMQDTSLMQKLNKVLTEPVPEIPRRTSGEGSRRPTRNFITEYQRFLKEGVVTDFTHKEALGKLLRYESSTLDAGQTHVAGGLREAHAVRPEGDLLPARRQPRGGGGQPVFRGVQGTQMGGAVPLRRLGRICDGAPAHLRRQDRCAWPRRRT